MSQVVEMKDGTSSVYKVTVVWGKQNIPVELDTGEDVGFFKSQIFSLTGVPPERQKMMVKGHIGPVTDNVSWSSIKGTIITIACHYIIM